MKIFRHRSRNHKIGITLQGAHVICQRVSCVTASLPDAQCSVWVRDVAGDLVGYSVEFRIGKKLHFPSFLELVLERIKISRRRAWSIVALIPVLMIVSH